MLRPFLILFALLLGFAASGATGQTVTGPARVNDGDTLSIAGERIRLFGIDAPELDQSCERRNAGRWACGRWSRDRLAEMVAGRNVSCDARTRDRYGRLVARCTAAGRDLAAAMVRAGAAEAYRRYTTDYVDEEKQAAFDGAGIWQGRMQAPEAYRAAERQAAAAASGAAMGAAMGAAAGGGCTIKGNVSQSGRIYHLPGQENYDDTRIDTSRGERWFCSEAEAVAAGWRRARR
jgi:endonuclease YncB( thermonuclease family)